MSNRFEQTPNPLLSVLPSLKPDLHEEPASPANPFLGWMSPGGGDSSALLPWVDDDLGRTESEDPFKPVSTALTAIDGVHFAHEVIHEGHEVAEVASEAANGAELAGTAADAILSPLAIAGGIMDVIEGVSELRKGNWEGAYSVGEGVLGAGSGACGLAAAAPLGAAMGAGAFGLKVGRYGDHKVKDLGWLRDSQGKAQSGTEWAGHLGRSADDWFTDRGHPWLGSAAGMVATTGGVIADMGIVPAAAAVGLGTSIGSGLAHHHRANHYAHYDGITAIQGGAEALADDDDARDAAIERSKHEHPERWRNPDTQTFGQWFAQLDTNLSRGGRP